VEENEEVLGNMMKIRKAFVTSKGKICYSYPSLRRRKKRRRVRE
jgi:hypothetical protein